MRFPNWCFQKDVVTSWSVSVLTGEDAFPSDTFAKWWNIEISERTVIADNNSVCRYLNDRELQENLTDSLKERE